MPYCDEYVELISAAVDGALSPEEMARLEEHLAQCPECRALYEDFAAIHSALGDVPPVTLPPVPAYMNQVVVAIDHQMDLREAKTRRSQRWGNWATTAAAVAAIALTGLMGFSARDLWSSESQMGSVRSAKNAPALSEESLWAENAQSDEEEISLQSEASLPEETEAAKQAAADIQYAAGTSLPSPPSQAPTAKEAVPDPAAGTPAPVQGPMLRSMPAPEGAEADTTAAEATDPVAPQEAAMQSFSISAPLPSAPPAEQDGPEEASEGEPLPLLTSAAGQNEDTDGDETVWEEEGESASVKVTPAEALNILLADWDLLADTSTLTPEIVSTWQLPTEEELASSWQSPQWLTGDPDSPSSSQHLVYSGPSPDGTLYWFAISQTALSDDAKAAQTSGDFTESPVQYAVPVDGSAPFAVGN